MDFVLNIIAGIIIGVIVAILTKNIAGGAGSTTVVIIVTTIIPGPVDEALVAAIPIMLTALKLLSRGK